RYPPSTPAAVASAQRLTTRRSVPADVTWADTVASDWTPPSAVGGICLVRSRTALSVTVSTHYRSHAPPGRLRPFFPNCRILLAHNCFRSAHFPRKPPGESRREIDDRCYSDAHLCVVYRSR